MLFYFFIMWTLLLKSVYANEKYKIQNSNQAGDPGVWGSVVPATLEHSLAKK